MAEGRLGEALYLPFLNMHKKIIFILLNMCFLLQLGIYTRDVRISLKESIFRTLLCLTTNTANLYDAIGKPAYYTNQLYFCSYKGALNVMFRM